ncbi:hypothetical protein H5410_047425 [Solanum commersonii]|uniref:Uncharacterized protein n=1 Tax=Solanum commersonii TaxID=4109 RepID=A0A9J5XH94_SOLCO|nr:hypothetical protein H5410_047425 [Solanum commersonii]
MARTWFDHWKGGRGDNAPPRVGHVLRRLSWGVSSRELTEEAKDEFVCGYGLSVYQTRGKGNDAN